MDTLTHSGRPPRRHPFRESLIQLPQAGRYCHQAGRSLGPRIDDTDDRSELTSRLSGGHEGAAVNVASLDLNLLVSLDALLRERSVTRAAQRLGLSQPALSASLGRLRRHFDDDLLVRTGNSYQLTPLAVQLAQRTAIALAGVERVFTAQAEFDPASCEREFTLLTSDYAAVVLGPAIVRVIAERAPRARVNFSYHSPEAVANAAERLRTADAMIIPHGFLSDLPHLDLYRDRWMCLVSETNRAVGERVTLDHLRELPWVTTYHQPTAYTPAGRQMELLGIEPNIQVVTDGFLPVAGLVANTDRIALLQERLVETVPRELGLRGLECPFDALPLAEALWWHPVSSHDPEHQFLRTAVRDAARSLLPAGGSSTPEA